MDIYLKVTGAVLIAVILCIMLAKYGKDYAILLSLAVCALVFMAAGSFLYPIFSFFSRLVQLGGLDSDFLNLLLKISGIAMITQIACLICADAGNKSMEKVLQILSSIVIIWIALPLLDEMLQAIESLLEAV